jgi:cytochrome b561
MDEQPKYDRVAAAFHWLTAALVVPLIVLGIGGEAVGGLFGMSGLETIFLHKSLGITVFFVVLLRLGWRLTHKPPPLRETTPAWQRRAASAVHRSFYGFLLGLPILGYLLSSSSPFPLEWFGHELPKAPVPKWVSGTADEIHVVGGLVLTGVLVLHIGAALWHQFVQRDRLIARMRVG